MKKKKLWLLIISSALLLGVGWLSEERELIREEKEAVKEKQVEREKSGQVDLVLDFGKGKVSTASMSLEDSPTVLEILSRVAEENNLKLAIKDFDFGVMVEEIGGVKNSQDHFWLYFVNGKMGEVAADKYQLKEEDLIEWKYQKMEK